VLDSTSQLLHALGAKQQTHSIGVITSLANVTYHKKRKSFFTAKTQNGLTILSRYTITVHDMISVQKADYKLCTSNFSIKM